MKKRKTYEISVIDKTYSKTISDETKFYTSDTALELGFELKETEYNFESAEIVLLNIDDRSLVTRPVSKVDNDFVYELEDDITAHYGEWRGQVRFEQAGEIYVSSPVKFRIENDLSNKRPPQLSDVQSWVSLKRYADSLTEELKQAVLSVEGIEDTFNENELERQTTFETAEQSRQDTFEANESERDETFENNETTRQAQELEREKAETTRQTTFDNNETNRIETFNANEAMRKSNEEARELAENERENSEEQRNIDHANRSAELDGKADKVVLKNLIKNGDFSDGLTHWTKPAGRVITEIVAEGVKITSTGERGRLQQIALSNMKANDILYVAAMVKTTNKKVSIVDANSPSHYIMTHSGSNEFELLSGTYSMDSGAYYPIVILPIADIVAILQWQMAINLTDIFGGGNEPTKEEMDELIKITGYINGEYALNNKEMLVWTLALIRRNKNAIITLGGA